MKTSLQRHFSSPINRWASIGWIGAVLSCTSMVSAQVTLVYSLEPDLEGFVANGGGLTISHETSGLGATEGDNSMKLEYADFGGFAGPNTPNVHPAFFDPLGLDFVRFDLTNTNRFVPPEPVVGVDPTFANVSVTFFGEFASAPGVEAQIQFLLSEEPIGDLEPGTHEIEIDLTSGGLDVFNGVLGGYDEFIANGFTPLEFQIYINKSVLFMDPDFAWTVYIDNIRVGRAPEGLPGDFNEDGTVDAADYVVWRKHDGTNNALPNDDGLGTPISAAHYDLWQGNFGGTTGGGALGVVPEPASGLLLLVAAGWLLPAQRARAGRGRA